MPTTQHSLLVLSTHDSWRMTCCSLLMSYYILRITFLIIYYLLLFQYHALRINYYFLLNTYYLFLWQEKSYPCPPGRNSGSTSPGRGWGQDFSNAILHLTSQPKPAGARQDVRLWGKNITRTLHLWCKM